MGSIAAALCLSMAPLLLCACGTQTPAPAPAATPAPTVTAAPIPEPTPEPKPEPTPEASPEPTPEPFRRRSGVAEDGSFDAGALFIGDSHTYYLLQYLIATEKIGQARYMAICGMSMPHFFDAENMPLGDGFSVSNVSACSKEFIGLSYGEAVAAAGEGAGAVYYMLGTNFSNEASTEDYLALGRYILEQCPNATLYLQTIPYSPMVDWGRVNDCIREAVGILEAEAPERVVLVDTHSAIPRSELLDDSIHYSYYAMEPWYDCLSAAAIAAAGN